MQKPMKILARDAIVRAAMKWFRSKRDVYFDRRGKATEPLHQLDRACFAYYKAKAAKKKGQ